MIIDLSLPIQPGMPVYPGDPATGFSPVQSHDRGGFSVHAITMSSHAGTHIDAPYHVDASGATIDSSAVLEACVGDALVVPVPGCENADIMPEDLADSTERLSPGDRILIATGWSDRFGSPDYFDRHPRLSPALAELFVSRRLSLVGVDFPSVHGPESRRVHRILLSAGIVIVENLNHLDRLPASIFFSAAPLRLTGLDGSPVRAYAWVE